MKSELTERAAQLEAVPIAQGSDDVALTASEGMANPSSFRGQLLRYASLWPSILGLASAHTMIDVCIAGSYQGTDEGVFTDGATAVALAALLIVAVILFKTRHVLDKRAINALGHAAFVVQFAVSLFMGFFRTFGLCTPPVRFAMSVLACLAGMLAIAYWLRRARGASMSTAAVLVFSAMGLSAAVEAFVFFVPDGIRCFAVGPLAIVQALCVRWARTRDRAWSIPSATRVDDYMTLVRDGSVRPQYLVASAVGLAALSLVAGFLRGFPHGEAIPFTPATRIVLFVVTELSFALLLRSTLSLRSRTMTVGIWVFMEILAAVTLVLYTAFPGQLEIGAITVTLLHTTISAFMWYLIIAYASCGWRDQLYYAIVVWAVAELPCAFGRLVLVNVMPTGGTSHFTGTVISLMTLVSALAVLSMMVDVAARAPRAGEAKVRDVAGNADDAPEDGAEAASEGEAVSLLAAPDERSGRPSTVEHLLGLDNDAGVSEVRKAAMRHHAEEMGRQFLLSDREVEVLALYASGYTQRRVAEELHISQTTAHTHIGRIYAKTGMHSRQEVLDYMHQYVGE